MLQRNYIHATLLTLGCGVFLWGGSSCTSSDHRHAQQILAEAEAAYQQQHYNRAHVLLDSLRTTYPSEVEVRRQGLALSRMIQMEEARRSQSYSDSLLNVVDGLVAEQSQKFEYVKSEYDDQGRFVYQGTKGEDNLRTYLHSAVNDYGETQLISSYRGTAKLGHTAVQVTCVDDGTSCITMEMPYDDASNYRYDIQGIHYETISYTGERDGGVLGFIAMHPTERLQVSLLGGAKPQTVTLTDTDREALIATFQFADLLKNRLRLMQELQISTDLLFRSADAGETRGDDE
jgi:hypothetical protein